MKKTRTAAAPPTNRTRIPANETEVVDVDEVIAPARRGRIGRQGKKFEPNELQRRQVITLAAHGNRPEVIAATIEVSEPTLRKYFHNEIRMGRMLGEAKNTKRLQSAADKGNVTAMIWLDKTRFGVRESEETSKKLRDAEEAKSASNGTAWAGLLQ